MAPIEAVLFAHSHPGMNKQKKVRQELLKPVPDGSAETNLLRVVEESDAPSDFCLTANSGRFAVNYDHLRHSVSFFRIRD
jgi:hypothetical protein